MSGRGRGTSNIPAWMSRQQREQAAGEGGPSRPAGDDKPKETEIDAKPTAKAAANGTGTGSAGVSNVNGGENKRSRSPPRQDGPRGNGRNGGGRRSRSPGFRGGGGGGGGPGGRRGDPHRGDFRRRGPPPRGGGGFNDGYRGPGGPGGYRDERDDFGREPNRRNTRRSRSPPNSNNNRSGRSNNSNRPGPRNIITFRSLEEERRWVEDRRYARQNRKSKLDVPPTPEQQMLMELREAADGGLAAFKGDPNAFGEDGAVGGIVGGGGAIGGLLQPQQTRHARRLYIGHLPEDVDEPEVHSFFRDAIAIAVGQKDKSLLNNPHSQPPADPEDDPVLSVYINRERRFAFVEFRTMEVCTACLSFDGINIGGKGTLRVKRPNDYNPALAPPQALQSSMASALPEFDVSKLGIVSGSVPDSPNKIFIGGLPYHLTESQVMELLSAFGAIRAFHLVKQDATAVTSKGYCFVEYADPQVTAVAVAGLHGMDMGGGKVLSARMAAARGTIIPPGQGAAEAAAAFALTAACPTNMQQDSSSVAPAGVVDGIDVQAMLDAALGGGGIAAPVADAFPQVPSSAPGVGAYKDMASAALDAAFGSTPAASVPSPADYYQPQASSVVANAKGPATKVLVLMNIVTSEDLETEEEHSDLTEEIKEEGAKFGALVSIKIPRLVQDGIAPSAIKKIFLEYKTIVDATNADKELCGRKFGPSVVETSYFDEHQYAAGALS
mmetsp:Transcript_42749/g.50011  ORF Transcript_42749/g.50011 Transcript_42749/m.50011 type:complete len:722 (+) Transcript_42749:179-2344(+)